MDVVSLCPLPAMGFTWQPRAGTCAQTVVVKGTFQLLPGESTLSEAQEAPTAADRAPYKSKADVVLVGHAYAPAKQPARSWMTRLVVGELDKSIEVWCDRGIRWQDGTLLEGPRVTKVPLVWERAAGGPETSNPVGMRFDAAPDRYGMVPIPNLQPPGTFVSSRADTFAPVCFAPIAPEWPRASARFGRLAQGWEERPFPEQFDYRYFQIATPDQQISAIRPNERIVLENLHPEHARLVTSLPGLRLRAVVDRATSERSEVQLFADTLCIDTTRGTCSVVWRGRVGLRHAGEAGRIAIWIEGMPHRAQTPSQIAIEEEPGETTITLVETRQKKAEPALPFVPGLSKLSEPAPPQPVPDLSRRAGLTPTDDSVTLFTPAQRPAGQPLRFQSTSEIEDEDGSGAKTLPPMARAVMKVIPFVAPIPPEAPMAVAQTPTQKEREEAPHPLPAPPPMIGPLGTLGTLERATKSEAPAEVPPREEPLTAPGRAAAAAAPEKPGHEEFPLERYAALTASIARRKAEKGRILEADGLTEGEWAAIEKHWAEAIRKEVKAGKNTLLARFDEAYVARLEDERGALGAEDYAKLMIAAERGTEEDVLSEMRLPRGALIRIERVWMRRLAKDSQLDAKVSKSMEAERSQSPG